MPRIADAQSSVYPEPLVISKVQLIFSIISHHAHVSDRVSFFDTKGIPQGNFNYVVPYLVCDPIVTLYNPTNATVTRSKARVAINNPPVGFRFKKNADYVRAEFASGQAHGVGSFQLPSENLPDARKSFTLLLRERHLNNLPGKAITLQAGEAKEFSPWVESDWTWGKEISQGDTPKQFNDRDAALDLTNRDGRTGQIMGVETTPGLDVRAGFQWEHLSYSTRPLSTRYDFEIANDWDGGWMGIKLNDTVTLEATPINGASMPDFSIDLLGGNLQDKSRDLRRSFPMDPGHLRLQNPQDPVASRTYRVSDILQRATDQSPGGKTPFAVLTMVAKSRSLVENRFYEDPPVPTEELYELEFSEIHDFGDQRRFVSPSDAPGYGLSVLKAVREADTFAIDLGTGPYPPNSYRVMGTASLEAGFNEDITSRSSFVRGPQDSGIGKLVINVAGLGERYFVRIEDGTGP